MEELLDEMDQLPDLTSRNVSEPIAAQKTANTVLRHATEWMLDPANNDINRKFAGANAFLHLAGTVVGGWLMTRAAHAAANGTPAARAWEFLASEENHGPVLRHHVLPRAEMHLETITKGGDSVLALAEDAF